MDLLYRMDNAINLVINLKYYTDINLTGDLFSDYINKMYSLRMEYEKGHPLNLIAKLTYE